MKERKKKKVYNPSTCCVEEAKRERCPECKGCGHTHRSNPCQTCKGVGEIWRSTGGWAWPVGHNKNHGRLC